MKQENKSRLQSLKANNEMGSVNRSIEVPICRSNIIVDHGHEPCVALAVSCLRISVNGQGLAFLHTCLTPSPVLVATIHIPFCQPSRSQIPPWAPRLGLTRKQGFTGSGILVR